MKFFFSGEIEHKVYRQFDKIENEVEKKIKILESENYGEDLVEVGIIPVIQKEEFFKERKLYQRKIKEADYRLFIDYKKFLHGNHDIRIKLLIKNIIDSVRSLDKKAKNFDGVRLEQNILYLFDLTKDDIDNL